MTTQPKWMTWVGWILTALVAAMLTMSATMKFLKPQVVTDGMAKFGYPEEALLPIGIAEISGVVLFLIPQTSALGAVLLTGYLGGAVATHVRVAEDFTGAVIFGVLVWLALFLRDPRVRALLPIRRPLPPAQPNP